MKTKKVYRALALVAFLIALGTVSCRKKEKEPEPEKPATPAQTADQQAAADNNDAKAENDQAISDINEIVKDQSMLAGRPAAGGVGSGVCGAAVDTLGIHNGSITVNYTGITCNNRTRTGTIKLHIKNYSSGKRWKDQGTVIGVQYVGYKVTRASDGASIQLDGFQDLTNVSGGSWVDLFLLSKTLVHTVTGTNLKLTFKDGSVAMHNINRKLTYTYVNNVLSAQGEGMGTNGNLPNLENYGTTRAGDAFTSQVITPIVWNSTCGAAVISGKVNIAVASKNFAVECLYGVDAAGNSMTVGANQCPYGWKMSWTVNNQTSSAVIKYQ